MGHPCPIKTTKNYFSVCVFSTESRKHLRNNAIDVSQCYSHRQDVRRIEMINSLLKKQTQQRPAARLNASQGFFGAFASPPPSSAVQTASETDFPIPVNEPPTKQLYCFPDLVMTLYLAVTPSLTRFEIVKSLLGTPIANSVRETISASLTFLSAPSIAQPCTRKIDAETTITLNKYFIALLQKIRPKYRCACKVIGSLSSRRNKHSS